MNETDELNQQCAWCHCPDDPTGTTVSGGLLTPLPDGQVSYHGPSITQATQTSLTVHHINGTDLLLCQACLFLATRTKS